MIAPLLVMASALRFASFAPAAPLAGASWTGVAIRARRAAEYFLKPFGRTG